MTGIPELSPEEIMRRRRRRWEHYVRQLEENGHPVDRDEVVYISPRSNLIENAIRKGQHPHVKSRRRERCMIGVCYERLG